MNQSDISVAKGTRNTNIELLRIIAMFLVLVVHANYWSLGGPTFQEVKDSFLPSMTRITLASISIVCVNVFIFISGWFTIKPSVKGFCNFLFQCGYFLIGIYVVMLATGQATLSLKDIAGCFCLTTSNWFIKAYIGLYLLSPILNLFIEKSSKKQLGLLLVSFYVFQTLYGFTGAAEFIKHGYSTFSFIGIYLLAQYVRRYVRVDYKMGGVLFIITTLINCGALLISYKVTLPVLTYDNPLVVLGALGLVIYFNGLNIKYSSFVNFVAKSSFAVFLLHTNPNIGEPIYQPLCKKIYNSFSGVECLAVFLLVLLAIFMTAIIIDIPRRYIWKWLSNSKKL